MGVLLLLTAASAVLILAAGGGSPVLEAQGNMSVLLQYLVNNTAPTVGDVLLHMHFGCMPNRATTLLLLQTDVHCPSVRE